MVSSDGLSRSYQKQYAYSPTDGSNVITLIDNKLTLLNDKVPTLDSTTWVNGYIKVLTCKSSINSLASVPMPNYLDTDTDSEKLTKTKAVVWDSPAYRLVIYLMDSGSTNWVEKIYYNLTNTFGFPYILTTLLDGLTTDIARDLPEGAKLGISFRDIGWGLPTAQDSIIIDCAWSAEYNWIKSYDVTISQPVVIQTATVQQVTQKKDSYTITLGTIAKPIISANANRLSGNLINSSTVIVYYGEGTTPTASVNSGSIPAGGTVPMRAGYTGAYSVIAASGANNSVTANETYNVAN